MKGISKIIIILGGLMTSMFSFGDEVAWNSPEPTYTYMDYCVEIDGVHYDYKVSVYGMWGPYEEGSSESIFNIYKVTVPYLVQMWHSENGDYPAEVTLPQKVRIVIEKGIVDGFHAGSSIDDEFDVCLDYFNYYTLPDERLKPIMMRSFNTLIIPKEVKRYSLPTVFASNYIVEEGNEGGYFVSDNCILQTSEYKGEMRTYLLQVPYPYHHITFDIPEEVTDYFGRGTFLDAPLKFNQGLKRLECHALMDYKFYGLELPDYIEPDSYVLSDSEMRTCERAYKCLSKNLVAAIVPDDIEEIFYSDLEKIYKLSSGKSNIRYLAWRTQCIPEIFIPNTDPYGKQPPVPSLEKEKKVVTFVRPELLEGFKKLQEDGLYPKNADIRAEEDMVFLYPELDNGQWVEGRSQFINAYCRFGDSKIEKTEWSTDNEELATVDENGVVTAKKKGDVIVSCKITDNLGNTHEATKRITLTDEMISSVKDILPDSVMKPCGGIYNLLGQKINGCEENLSPGIYIIDGKKVVKR